MRDLLHYGVVGIDEDSFLFEAALLMARRKVRHLVVRCLGDEPDRRVRGTTAP